LPATTHPRTLDGRWSRRHSAHATSAHAIPATEPERTLHGRTFTVNRREEHLSRCGAAFAGRVEEPARRARRRSVVRTKAPPGKANRWIHTTFRRGWFVYMRLYGPEGAFDGGWSPGDCDRV